MIRTSANTDAEKTSDYRCRGNIRPFFAGTDFPTQIKFRRPVRLKTSLGKILPYFHRHFANHVFARPGREKRPKNPRTRKGAKANPIKRV